MYSHSNDRSSYVFLRILAVGVVSNVRSCNARAKGTGNNKSVTKRKTSVEKINFCRYKVFARNRL